MTRKKPKINVKDPLCQRGDSGKVVIRLNSAEIEKDKNSLTKVFIPSPKPLEYQYILTSILPKEMFWRYTTMNYDAPIIPIPSKYRQPCRYATINPEFDAHFLGNADFMIT